jgi:excisionase family DNA binding protein
MSALLRSVREAARELGIGRDSAYQLVRTGRLRSITVGRRRLIPSSELQAFIAREMNGGEVIDASNGRADDEGPIRVRRIVALATGRGRVRSPLPTTRYRDLGGLMRRITAIEDERSIRLIFDDDLDRCKAGCMCTCCEQIPAAFVGYEIAACSTARSRPCRHGPVHARPSR